ncbi:MAG: sulfatase-like hydrolase/transferase, partial [Pirellulales bacterium]
PTDTIEAHRSEEWEGSRGEFWRGGGIAPNLKLKNVLPRFTNEAIQVIQRHAENEKETRPLMLYLAYPAPHAPWLPSPEFVGKSGASMYGDFVMMVDAQIGRVLETLRKAEMEEDTLLVFMSDNGPHWHDTDVERLGHDSAGGLRGKKGDAWEAGHRMPMIVRWPESVKESSQSDQLVCFTDLLATFAQLLDVDLPENAGPDSFSFLPELIGQQPEATSVRTQFVMRAGSYISMMTIRSGDWKLINGLGSGGFSKPKHIKPGPGDPQGQLYNLAEDINETTNLYLKHPEIVKRLTAELNQNIERGHSHGKATASKPVR